MARRHIEVELKNKIAVFFVIILSGTCIGHADESVESKAVFYLSNVLFATSHEAIDARSKQSGLADSEIDEVIENATRSYAICVVDALTNNTGPDSEVILRKLADGASSVEIQGTFSDSTQAEIDAMKIELKSVVLPCIFSVNQELGIVD